MVTLLLCGEASSICKLSVRVAIEKINSRRGYYALAARANDVNRINRGAASNATVKSSPPIRLCLSRSSSAASASIKLNCKTCGAADRGCKRQATSSANARRPQGVTGDDVECAASNVSRSLAHRAITAQSTGGRTGGRRNEMLRH